MSKKGATKDLTPKQKADALLAIQQKNCWFHRAGCDGTCSHCNELLKEFNAQPPVDVLKYINEAKPATVPKEWILEHGKHIAVETEGPEVAVAAEPKTPPTLTADQKVQILTLQRNAVLAEGNKLRTDAAFEKAYAELNKAYAAVNNIQGFALDQLSLEFVATS